MSYGEEEEDTMRMAHSGGSTFNVSPVILNSKSVVYGGGYMHVIWGGGGGYIPVQEVEGKAPC